jgi:diguanylate cyclase (GGDEF)-like protein
MFRIGIVGAQQQGQAPRAGSELRNVRRLVAVCLIVLAAAGGGLVVTVFNTKAWFNAKSGEIERQQVHVALANSLAARPHLPVVATAMELAALLSLPDARIAPRQSASDLELSARLPGDTEAYLVWAAPRLGTAGMLNFAPTRLPLLLGIGAASALLLFKLERLARTLDRERQMASRLAGTDTLTGLGNRRAFHEELAARLKDGGTFALACIDLDGFKSVNDRHGHAAGDAVLSGVASRLARILGPGDRAYRLGGDEFALLLEAKERDLTRFAKKIVLTLDDSYELDGQARGRVGASVGIAMAPIDAVEAERLMSRADAALYVAKGERGSTYRFAGDLPAPAMVSAA